MNKGLTLVEVLIVVFVVGVISAGIVMALSSARQSWDITEIRTALQLELRKTVSRMSDDLKQTSMSKTYKDSMNTSLAVNDTSSALYFYLPQDIDNATGAIIWNTTALISYTLVNGTIIRTSGTTPLNIASDITGLNFTRLANDVIQIDVSSQKIKAVEHGNATVDAALASAVAVRN